MKKLAPFLLLTLLAGPALLAEDTPPATNPGAGAAAAGGENGNNNGRNRDQWMKRMVADNPELKDVDLNSPEGQEKIRQVMQKRMEENAPRIRQRMAEQQTASHAELNKQLAMNAEEFKAIEPLLTRVESLRMQRGLVDRAANPMLARGGGRGGPGGGPGGFMSPQLMMGDTPLEPSVQETQEASKALKTLVDDAQANANELTATIARLRKAREAFTAVLNKAQDDLRAVLSPRQEAILVERGTLE
jgi:hypothetical protein